MDWRYWRQLLSSRTGWSRAEIDALYWDDFAAEIEVALQLRADFDLAFPKA